jgi:hypothetical protein
MSIKSLLMPAASQRQQSPEHLLRQRERAGLPWDEARLALNDEGWRKVADDNRAEMFALGLCGACPRSLCATRRCGAGPFMGSAAAAA